MNSEWPDAEIKWDATDDSGWRALRSDNERLRAALLDAIEEMESMILYVPDYFREKWGYDEAIAKAKAAAQLGRGGTDG